MSLISIKSAARHMRTLLSIGIDSIALMLLDNHRNILNSEYFFELSTVRVLYHHQSKDHVIQIAGMINFQFGTHQLVLYLHILLPSLMVYSLSQQQNSMDILCCAQ